MSDLDSFDDQPPPGHSALQYLLGAAAGCIIGGAAAIALFVCLMQGGFLSSETIQPVVVVMGIAPIFGAAIAVWIMAGRRKQ